MKGLESRIEKIERKSRSRSDLKLSVSVSSSREEIDEKVEKLRERFGFEGYPDPNKHVVSWMISTDRDGKEHLEFRTPLVPEKPLRTA